KSFHRTPYPSISPSRPELSQTRKTVLVTGGNSGIGYAIAEAFLQASARKVFVTGRRAEATEDAAAQLTTATNGQGEAVGLVCDVFDAKAVDELWNTLEGQGTTVDVLVLNAVKIPKAVPLLENGAAEVWKDFDANVRAQLQWAERFYKQQGQGVPGPKVLINVSTFAIHDHRITAEKPAYGLTKNAASLAMQLIAQDTPAEKMHVVNFNPGGVFTQATRKEGWKEDAYAFNSAELPGQFAVWLASVEAAFLHGRFVWTEWDVEELKSGPIRERIEQDPDFLKVGVNGL
ncbi:short chain dehydrogenase, partial [Bimuria novae-zelandiae CBS 107.79]